MKTLVYIGTSLDGFIARENGDFDWLSQFANDEAIQSYNEFMDKIDVIVMGRGTYEKVLTFPTFPYSKKVYVLSKSIMDIPRILTEQVTIFAMKPSDIIIYLSDKGYSNIYVDGGKVIQDFLKEDLINELIISKAPILLGSGIPLFGYLGTDLQFNHVRTTVQSNGLVRSYYVRTQK